jgi:hypothetical protein
MVCTVQCLYLLIYLFMYFLYKKILNELCRLRPVFYPVADLFISSSQYPYIFFKVQYFIPTLLHLCHPSDSNVSENAGIEPRTAAISALEVRRSKHWAIQYLIHTRLDLTHNSARSHPYPARSHLHSARSHPQLG